MNKMKLFTFLLVVVLGACSVEKNALTIVIRNNPDYRSRLRAEQTKTEILQEASQDGAPVNVLLLHEPWAPQNAWAILPIFPYLADTYHERANWVFFCEDNTEIKLQSLLKVLQSFDSEEKLFIGHALHDTTSSIIHHFAFFNNNPQKFKYPDFDAGWAITMPLLLQSVNRLQNNPPKIGFTIDVQHEVAMFLHEDGILLTDVSSFCINKPLSEKCATAVGYLTPECGVVDAGDVLVSVKTCEKFHGSRLPITKRTSSVNAKHIRYYSDIVDRTIPTVSSGVKNTNSGHCAKLKEIIYKFSDEEWKEQKWLVIIDDDTIMNFKRLQSLLACYDSDEAVLLGERYGYGVNYKNVGYSYPTGGSGMILNRKAVDLLLADENCSCRAPDAPDDMWLGACFGRLRVPMVHSKSLHQTFPSQYSHELLSHRYLVSFHTHTEDPMNVYKDYLGGSVGDERNGDSPEDASEVRIEL